MSDFVTESAMQIVTQRVDLFPYLEARAADVIEAAEGDDHHLLEGALSRLRGLLEESLGYTICDECGHFAQRAIHEACPRCEEDTE